ncbi:hypothetical protein ACFL0R_00655 [Pseudomonadota bacterium]
MPIDLYDIFFSGTIMEGHNEAEVKTKVGRIFKAEGARLERLFSGQPIRVKAGVDLDTAVKYRVTFRDAGALVDIKPSDAPADTGTQTTQSSSSQPPPQPAESHTSTDEISLLPPRTGSLEDCAEKVAPAPLPDISGLSMDRPGITLDETEPPPPVEINTEGLSDVIGSLEDCQQPVEPAELPDISGITMEQPGIILDETEPPPPVEIDTEGLSSSIGSLEDCQQQVEPVEIPDTSAMDIVSPEDETD